MKKLYKIYQDVNNEYDTYDSAIVCAELATKIIFETTNGLSNWYNCTKKVNAKGQLETINMLLK